MSQQNTKHKKLISFLEKHRSAKGDVHTNTSMGNPKGAFNIPDNEYDEFLTLYQKSLFDGNKLALIEKHKGYGPILIDLDFRHDLDEENKRIFTKEYIKKILKLYYDNIKNIFILDEQTQLIAFVFERDGPYVLNGVKRDGVHIMFPYIITEPNAQYYLREQVLKDMTDTPDITESLKLKNNLYDVVDRAVIEKNGWFLIGSTKPNRGAYNLAHIYDKDLNNMDNSDIDYEGFDNLAGFFSIRRHSSENIKLQEHCKEQILKISQKKIRKKKIKKIYSIHNYNVERISELVNIMSTERANDYHTWMEVGWALHNINPDDIEILNIWIDFSKKSKKYKEGECENRWDKFKNDGYSLASVYYWAKMDNKTEWEKILRKDIQYYISESENSTNYDVAKVLHVMFEHQFVCTQIKGKIWYEFNNNRWIQTENGISLRQRISGNEPGFLLYEFMQYIDKINHQVTEGDLTEEESEELMEKQKKYFDIMIRLKCTKFKEDIMRECIDLFYNPKFEEKLDENPYLIGFENGIFDLRNHEFRDGKPDDYVTMSTGLNYVPLSDNSDHLEDIKLFMKQIQPIEEVRDYLLTELSTCLEGVNEKEKFRIWTGTGGNGKSKLIEIFLKAFGEYCIKFPITLLTGKRAKSNAATPEVVTSKGKRFAYLEEPNEGERINCGLMKEFTGGDKIKGRGLYQSFVEFKPQFKMFLLCNELPEVPGNDNGVWRRMEVIGFESNFVDNPVESHEYKKDGRLSEKINTWGENFMSLLLEYHEKNSKNRMDTPDEVLKYTKEYKETSDAQMMFFTEYVLFTEDKADSVKYSDMFNEYKLWAYEAGIRKLLTKKEFNKYLEKLYRRKYRGRTHLRCYKMNPDADGTIEENEGDNDEEIVA
jgi:P4 family phage/plasmid primase-like protien